MSCQKQLSNKLHKGHFVSLHTFRGIPTKLSDMFFWTDVPWLHASILVLLHCVGLFKIFKMAFESAFPFLTSFKQRWWVIMTQMPISNFKTPDTSEF